MLERVELMTIERHLNPRFHIQDIQSFHERCIQKILIDNHYLEYLPRRQSTMRLCFKLDSLRFMSNFCIALFCGASAFSRWLPRVSTSWMIRSLFSFSTLVWYQLKEWVGQTLRKPAEKIFFLSGTLLWMHSVRASSKWSQGQSYLILH